MRGVFESEGDIRSVDLLSALVALWREKAGGALRFSRPGATAGFAISGGEVTATLSSQAQFDAAAILIRAAKLDPAAVERLAMPEGSDAALAAMQAGLITAREWRWGQKIRAIEILSDLLGWLEGEYVLEPGDSAPPGDWTLPVPRLVLELFLRSRDRTLVEHYLGPSDLPLLRAESFDEEFETFGLTADAGSVVRLIDGKASAEEIAERSPADEFAVLKLLAALTTLGLVHPAEAAPAAPPRRPAALPREPRSGPSRPPEPPREVKEEGPPPESELEAEQPARPGIEPAAEEEAPSGIEQEAREEEEPEAQAAPEQPKEQEEETVPEFAAEPAEPAVAPRRAPEPEPLAEPDRRLAGQTRASADTGGRPASHEEAFDRALNLTGGSEPPPDPPKSGSGVVLAVLLAALIIAVATLVIVRARGASHEQSAATNLHATARENPVFPPAETAVPLPGHGRGAGPSPVRTAAVTLEPAAGLTAPPMAAQPLTRVPTHFQPTLPPTRVPTPIEPTKPPTRVPTPIEPTKPPTRVPTPIEPTKPPTRVPTPPEPTKPPTRAPTSPEPTRPAAPARVPPPTAAVAATRGELTRADWIRRAERDKRSVAKRRDVRYSVQLELACELPTLENALNWDRPPGTIWLVTSSYRGRTCFRVLWGRYGSLAEARAAKTRVPEIFTASGNRPTVVSAR